MVTRNNNYSTDSYLITEEGGITFYLLHQKDNEKLPEAEYFSQKNMVLRMKVDVEAPYDIEILNGGNSVYKTHNLTHSFVLEMDMRLPPEFSDFRLSPR